MTRSWTLIRPDATLQWENFSVPKENPIAILIGLLLLVNLVPVHAVTGPLQDSCEFVVRRRSLNLTRNPILRMPVKLPVLRILAQCRNT